MKSVCIMMYHQVGDFKWMDSHRSVYCHYLNFRKQMAYLHRMGYSVISLDDALAGLNGESPLPKRAVVLTFDDGYENFYQYAVPEMARYGFPSVSFILSDKIGKRADWLMDDGLSTANLMDRRMIEELKGSGVEFASHGRTHRKLPLLSSEEKREEIIRSKSELEDLLQAPVRHFCYPYGDYDDESIQFAKEAGYEAALSCIRGRATPDDDWMELPRMACSFSMSLAGFVWKLHFQRR